MSEENKVIIDIDKLNQENFDKMLNQVKELPLNAEATIQVKDPEFLKRITNKMIDFPDL